PRGHRASIARAPHSVDRGIPGEHGGRRRGQLRVRPDGTALRHGGPCPPDCRGCQAVRHADRAIAALLHGGQSQDGGFTWRFFIGCVHHRDPVRDGLVASLNRPGGNVTGVSFLNSVLAAKRLELLHQIVPKATIIAAMSEKSSSPDIEAERRDLLAPAQSNGQQLIALDVSSDREIETDFTTLVQRGAGALHVGTGAFMNSQRERIVALAARYRTPAIYNWREAVAAGGLMSYAPSITDAYRQAGIYAGRILKGE